jgi:hypothetical protein
MIHPTWLTATSLAALAIALCAGDASAAGPVPLIFDTDFCGDCDDVQALALIHALQARGACRLLAVTVSADHDLAAPMVDAVNTFYGRGDIPIGVVGKGGVAVPSAFLKLAVAEDEGRPRYPHDLASGRDAPSATAVLRRTLAAQEDGSVVVVQVGFSTNLARLLGSPADDLSPLTGEELVRRKVKLLSLMAGAFRPIDGNARYLEYNVVKDVAGLRTLAERWPSPMVFSGFEVGIALVFPYESLRRDFAYVPHHPVAEAGLLQDPARGRPTWDLTSVLYAIHPDRGYFDLSLPGVVAVDADGATRFKPGGHGRHRHLVLRPEQAPRVLEALVQLASQPPCITTGDGRSR